MELTHFTVDSYIILTFARARALLRLLYPLSTQVAFAHINYIMTFKDLQLSEPILQALQKINYTTPTPIQEKSIPVLLKQRDLFGCAQTGTGKTASFALPILELLQNDFHVKQSKPVQCLILAPTRELALQIYENIVDYSVNLSVRSVVIFGGVAQQNQVNQIRRGADILVATPGRLLDLMNQGIINLQTIKHFVLDEADRMLDMGFIADIKKIVAKLPAKRQTIMFSATIPNEIRKLVEQLLKDPEYVSVTPISSGSAMVSQQAYFVSKDNKKDLLQYVIENDKIEHALVFTRTKHGADRVAKLLVKKGITAASIHGDKSQNSRQNSLNGFKDRKIRVLVATDIAARGIDVDQLSHVINFEIPEVAETYIHRIGRTGRAGNTGTAISFVMAEEQGYFNSIKKLVQTPIEIVKEHPYMAGASIPSEKAPDTQQRPKGPKPPQNQQKKNYSKPGTQGGKPKEGQASSQSAPKAKKKKKWNDSYKQKPISWG